MKIWVIYYNDLENGCWYIDVVCSKDEGWMRQFLSECKNTEDRWYHLTQDEI